LCDDLRRGAPQAPAGILAQAASGVRPRRAPLLPRVPRGFGRHALLVEKDGPLAPYWVVFKDHGMPTTSRSSARAGSSSTPPRPRRASRPASGSTSPAVTAPSRAMSRSSSARTSRKGRSSRARTGPCRDRACPLRPPQSLRQRTLESGSSLAGAARERWSVNVVPCPSVLSTTIEPPIASTRCFTIDRPRPVPPISRDRPVSTR
jgi:hypothetical protein